MSGFGSIWIVKESMRLYRPWPGSTRRATPCRRIVCLRCVVRKLGVVPVAIERQPECSSIPMEEHRKEHKPCDQRRYDVAVWISERNMKNNIRHSERCRCPSVVDIGRAEEIAGFPFEFEITVATAFVHSNETGEQLSFAAQWATQPKSSVCNQYPWERVPRFFSGIGLCIDMCRGISRQPACGESVDDHRVRKSNAS